MIFVKATDTVDLRQQLQSMFPESFKVENMIWKDKVKSYDNLCEAKPGAVGGIIFADKKSDEIIVREWAGVLTVCIPKKFGDREVHIKYV